MPLFWIGLFRAPRRSTTPTTRAWLDANGGAERAKISDLTLSWTREQYTRAFDKVEDYIAAGDVYQINLTLKYRFAFEGDPVALYAALRRKQRVAYGALIGAPDFDVLSLSPELFFRREGKHMSTRPMKGTAPRGRTPREDARLKTWLAMDEKQRAENLMIVDLLRNDLGRVAKIGSVEVTDLFTVETYRSVHQMTSGISAELRSDMGLKDMLRALFPCGSVTGAPKVRAMEIIRELEAVRAASIPAPSAISRRSGDAQFNVAIRTVVLDARWWRDGHRQRHRRRLQGRFRVRGMPAQGAVPDQGRRALRADRDHSLRAGHGLPSARAASRAAAILRRAFRLPLRARGGARRARSRRPRASRRRSRMVRLLLAEDGDHHRHLDRDRAARPRTRCGAS